MNGYHQGDHRSNISAPPSVEKTSRGAWLIYWPKSYKQQKPIAVRAHTAFKAKELAAIVMKVDTRQFNCEFLEASELVARGITVVITSEIFRINPGNLTTPPDSLE
jgi:hypothetical protein